MKKKLKEICNITMGQSPDSSSYNKNSDGMPFFQGNADFGKLYPTIRTWTNCAKKIAKKDDILISVRAPIGALNYTNVNCCIGRGLAAITPFEYVCSKYIFYLLKSQKNNLNAQGIGSTFKAIGRSNLENIEVPELNISAQQKIANHLDSIQTAIDNKQQQLKELDEIVKSRFIEMFGDPVQNPVGWEVRKLESIADIVSGITKGRKTRETELIEVPYMAVSNVKSGYIDWSTIKTIEATKTEIAMYQLKVNDVLMTEGGDPDKVGRGALLTTVPKNCIHQNHIFRVRLHNISPIYFSQYLQHEKSKRYFLSCAKQTTGIASINMTQLKSLPVLIPFEKQQNDFASFVQQIDKSKFVVKQQIKDLQELMDSKMQEYFGG